MEAVIAAGGRSGARGKRPGAADRGFARGLLVLAHSRPRQVHLPRLALEQIGAFPSKCVRTEQGDRSYAPSSPESPRNRI
jgi:hypothetical protein